MTEGSSEKESKGNGEGLALAVAPVAALLALSAPPWPDDWDGLGFVGSIARFDLDRFQPHPPGYPVYVALLKAASSILPTPLAAANVVAVASGALGLLALGKSVRATSPRAEKGWGPIAVVLAVAACPLVWRCASAVGSEAPAFACAAAALFGLARRDTRGGVVAGLMVGLGIGVRVSWAPLLLPMLLFVPRGARLRAVAALAGALFSWAVPLVGLIGARHLVDLLRTHLAGHASRWGGTALTEPARVRYLLRDLFVDGLGAGPDGLGFAVAALTLVAIALALRAWRRAQWRAIGPAAIVLGPYLAWIAVGQNLRQEPRHALPLVISLAAGLALAAVFDRSTRVPVAALFALAAVRTALDAHDRRTIAPPGAQLVALVGSLPDAEAAMVFGGRSARFFERTPLATRAMTVGSMGDVTVALGRVDRLPARVFVTSELEDRDASPYVLQPFATLSRPARIDRRAPTLEVFEARGPF